jgi:hypothetical protein
VKKGTLCSAREGSLVVDSGNREEEQHTAAGARPTVPPGEQPTSPGHQPSSAGQQLSSTQQASQEVQKSPPYNLWFALSAIGIALVAYVVTIIVFGTKFDSAAATAALGALFTLIGTVCGAYFGIKNSSNTADRAERTTKEAQERASNAAGALDSGEWERLKDKGLL